MKLLELFSGSGIMSQTFRERGHHAVTADMYQKADITGNILNLDLDMLSGFDVVWMSPPCQTLSMASGNTHWTADKRPKTEKGRETRQIIDKCIDIIEYCVNNNKIFFLENPRARMRWFLPDDPMIRITVCYCRYGEKRMKPTDIWTNCNTWRPIDKMCHNGCSDHEPAPRGSKTGTQGLKGAYERGKLPKQLCIEVCKACEGLT